MNDEGFSETIFGLLKVREVFKAVIDSMPGIVPGIEFKLISKEVLEFLNEFLFHEWEVDRLYDLLDHTLVIVTFY